MSAAVRQPTHLTLSDLAARAAFVLGELAGDGDVAVLDIHVHLAILDGVQELLDARLVDFATVENRRATQIAINIAGLRAVQVGR